MGLHLVFKLWWLHYPRGWILFCYTSTSLLKIKKNSNKKNRIKIKIKIKLECN